jgi:DNA/RNA-binding domain of Phe-tRNA-synthetase-like protein
MGLPCVRSSPLVIEKRGIPVFKLVIHEEARRLGVAHPVACAIQPVRVTPSDAALDGDIRDLLQILANAPDTILSRPEVRGFGELFSCMGYPKQKPAGQRLIESFQRKGFKRISNVVDSYNVASALFGSGLGMHDASKLTGDIHISRASGTEIIVPMFKSAGERVTTGDLLYSSGDRPLAWLGKRDVDSDEFKVTDTTEALLLVVLGNAATDEHYNKAACQKAFDLIRLTCPDAQITFLERVS